MSLENRGKTALTADSVSVPGFAGSCRKTIHYVLKSLFVQYRFVSKWPVLDPGRIPPKLRRCRTRQQQQQRPQQPTATTAAVISSREVEGTDPKVRRDLRGEGVEVGRGPARDPRVRGRGHGRGHGDAIDGSEAVIGIEGTTETEVEGGIEAGNGNGGGDTIEGLRRRAVARAAKMTTIRSIMDIIIITNDSNNCNNNNNNSIRPTPIRTTEAKPEKSKDSPKLKGKSELNNLIRDGKAVIMAAATLTDLKVTTDHAITVDSA